MGGIFIRSERASYPGLYILKENNKNEIFTVYLLQPMYCMSKSLCASVYVCVHAKRGMKDLIFHVVQLYIQRSPLRGLLFNINLCNLIPITVSLAVYTSTK